LYTIYKITNPEGKVYIGQTKVSLKERLSRHYNNAKRFPSWKIAQSLLKYGKSSHEIEALEKVKTRRKAEIKEAEYIKKYDSIEKGLNTRFGLNVDFTLTEIKQQFDKAMS